MIKIIPHSLRERLRKIDWLARFYRKYIIRLPFDHEMNAGNYNQVKTNNDLALSLLPFNHRGLIIGVKS